MGNVKPDLLLGSPVPQVLLQGIGELHWSLKMSKSEEKYLTADPK